MDAPEIQSQRGNDKFHHNGYLYIKDKLSADGEKVYWRCDKKNAGCKGRIWTLLDGTFHSLRADHACAVAGNAARVEVQTIVTRMKRRAEATMENPAQIRAEAIQNATNAVLGQMPTANATRKIVQRQRQDGQIVQNPQNRQEIIIPDRYAQYEPTPGVQENFLLADSGADDEQRVMIFGRAYNETWSDQMQEVFMDGTFLLSPPLFSQIFVILARRDRGFVFPVMFCLLPSKTAETYTKLFRMIREMWPRFNPEAANMDYEIGIHQALRTEFPDTEIRGCLFHLVQNLRKHLSNQHLLGRYNTNAEFALQARMVTSVAFVPEQDVVDALTALEEHLPQDLEPIISWFTNTYVGRLRNNSTRALPTFPYGVWNVYQRTLDGNDRTNNFAEACHRRMQLGFGVAHPNLWKFIAGLKKMQKGIDADYENYVAGREPPHKRSRYQEADQRILNKVRTYNAQNMIEYLRGLSYNYQME